jgi:hypothetical protein
MFAASVPDPGSGSFLTSGSGIWCLFDPWIRDQGWVKNPDPGSGSGMNSPDHISQSLETIFWVKIFEFFNSDTGWKKFGSGMEKIRIRDPDPQHCLQQCVGFRSALILLSWIRIFISIPNTDPDPRTR